MSDKERNGHTVATGSQSITVDAVIEQMGLGTFSALATIICGLANAADAVVSAHLRACCHGALPHVPLPCLCSPILPLPAILPLSAHWPHPAPFAPLSLSLLQELLCISFILPEFPDVGPTARGILSASVFAGMLLGGLVAGLASDKLGRKPMMAWSLGINAIFGAVSAAAPDWGSLAACRVLAGFGVGGCIPTLFTLFTEYLPVARRGAMISLVAACWMMGTIYGAGMAWLMIGALSISWRYYAIVCAIPAVLGWLLLLLALPESPRFLMAKGRTEEAIASLSKMAKISKAGGQVYASIANLQLQLLADAHPEGLEAAEEGGAEAGQASRGRDGSMSSHSSGQDSPVLANTAAKQKTTAVSVDVMERAGLLATAPAAAAALVTAEKGEGSVLTARSSAGRWDSSSPRLGTSSSSSSLHESSSGSLAPAAAVGGGRSARSSSSSCFCCSCFGQQCRDACASGFRSASLFLSPQLRRSSICLSIIWFCLSFGWYGLSLWIPSIFKEADVDLDPYQDSFVVAAANLPGNIVAALILDRLGRKVTLSGACFLSFASALCFAFSKTQGTVLAAASAMNFFSVSAWNSLDCLSVESYPTKLRSGAMGMLAASGRVGSILGQLIFSALLKTSVLALIATAAGMLLVAAVTGLALPQETAGQQLHEDPDSQQRAAEAAMAASSSYQGGGHGGHQGDGSSSSSGMVKQSLLSKSRRASMARSASAMLQTLSKDGGAEHSGIREGMEMRSSSSSKSTLDTLAVGQSAAAGGASSSSSLAVAEVDLSGSGSPLADALAAVSPRAATVAAQREASSKGSKASKAARASGEGFAFASAAGDGPAGPYANVL